MNAFRVLALAYAVGALLIAPSWIAADTLGAEGAVPPAPPVAPAEPAAEPAPADEAPVVVAQEADEPAAETAPKAAAAQKEKDEPVAKAAADGSVTITDFKFTPSTITVNVGDTVTWTNEGPTVHTATANDGSFDTGNLDEGESGSATFNEAGTIAYICSPHPFMKGKVVVRAASAGDGGGSDSGGTAGDEESDPTATTADDEGGLPATGGETLAIALMGLATIAAGMLLRRREHARR